MGWKDFKHSLGSHDWRHVNTEMSDKVPMSFERVSLCAICGMQRFVLFDPHPHMGIQFEKRRMSDSDEWRIHKIGSVTVGIHVEQSAVNVRSFAVTQYAGAGPTNG